MYYRDVSGFLTPKRGCEFESAQRASEGDWFYEAVTVNQQTDSRVEEGDSIEGGTLWNEWLDFLKQPVDDRGRGTATEKPVQQLVEDTSSSGTLRYYAA